MTPQRITPGKPAPTDSMGPLRASSPICRRRMPRISLAGIAFRSICGCPGSGYIRTAPSCVSSTMPAQRYRVASTPTLRAIGLLKPNQLVDAVKRRRLIALGQCRIIKYRFDEIIDRALQDHHRLPDVQQFGCPFADDVDAENLACLAVEN